MAFTAAEKRERRAAFTQEQRDAELPPRLFITHAPLAPGLRTVYFGVLRAYFMYCMVACITIKYACIIASYSTLRNTREIR